MKKYRVTIYFQTYIEVEVETSSPDEAEALAYAEAGKSEYDEQALSHLKHDIFDGVEIEEIGEEEEL